MFNRPQFIIRSITQNSKICREKFINNKKKYNLAKAKQYGFNIITRKFHTNFVPFSSFGGGGGPRRNGPNNLFTFILFCLALSAYVSSKKK